MLNEAFIGKEMEKKKKDVEEEKRKGDDNDGGKNGGGGAKRGEKMRGGIDRSASKGDNEDVTDSWDDHDLDMEGKEGEEW